MSVDPATVDPATDGPATGNGARRSWPVRVALALGLLVVLVAVALGVRWWTHPAIFGDLGDSYASDPRPVTHAALSTTVIFPLVEGEPETVTIDRVEAVFTKNTAAAVATFWICHLSPGEDPIGGVHDPEEYCADLEPFEAGASFRHGVAPDSDYLLVTIEPTSPGVAKLVSVEVAYQRGAGALFQQGTESIRAVRIIRAE